MHTRHRSMYKTSKTRSIGAIYLPETDLASKYKRLHGPNSGAANMMPIAYFSFDGSGSILTSSGNVTYQGADGTGTFDFEINNGSISLADYIVVATSLGTNPGIIHITNNGGLLRVKTYEQIGVNDIKNNIAFSVVIYKP